MKQGIVGNGEDKFTEYGKAQAMVIIADLLYDSTTTLVSGHSPVGGIDIWAEQFELAKGKTPIIYAPTTFQWNPKTQDGYKWRNEMIAKESDAIVVIVADVYPNEYKGHRFKLCYHCRTTNHLKSGACWTAKKAMALGKPATWYIVKNYASV